MIGRRLSAALASVALLAAGLPARAQLDTDFQAWGMLTATWRGPEPVRWYLEEQPRTRPAAGALAVNLLRGALGLDVGAGFSLWAGYGWTPLVSPTWRNEHRIFQQLLGEHALGSATLVNRTRFEQRILQGADGPSLRARHLLRLVVPTGLGDLNAVAQDELFVHLSSTAGGPSRGFDQNRAFAGLNYEFIPGVTLEAGYLGHYVKTPAAVPDRWNHVLLVWVALMPDEW